MVRIEELMDKDSISGEDIGKLIISNDICMYKKQIGDAGFADYVPPEQEVLDSLTDRIDSFDPGRAEIYVVTSFFSSR